ncbi:hypothetical protein [Propionivibrio sp.]|uniref:hypothetical protein n=1 Tax=Propionivibrio sp. TaxID=2212460 RepID=UPI003BEFC8C8
MKMKELVYALKISESMGYRLKKEGMPTHSIEAAEKWRAKNLDPVRTKENRVDGNTGEKTMMPKRPAETSGSIDPFWGCLEDWFRVRLPRVLFDPYLIAAASADLDIHMTGAQAIRLGQFLFLNYTGIAGKGDSVGFEIPGNLNHPPKSSGFTEEANRIDCLMEQINSEMNGSTERFCGVTA